VSECEYDTYLFGDLEVVDEFAFEFIEGASVNYVGIEEWVEWLFDEFVQVVAVLLEVFLHELEQL
jgi:hypothetical protein